jgi:hypothetical protein
MLFEDPAVNPVGIFAEAAAIPELRWKSAPQTGHLKGVIRDESGGLVDTGAVIIERVSGGQVPPVGRTLVSTASDGSGFYGGVDLAPGTFRVAVTPVGGAAYKSACTATVMAGQVASLDITIDRTAPTGTLEAAPSHVWPPNRQVVMITLTGDLTDIGTGLASVVFRVIDEYGLIQPAIDPVMAAGQSALRFTRTFELEASRLGGDRDGRTYTLEAVVADRACNAITLRTTVVVSHDQRY